MDWIPRDWLCKKYWTDNLSLSQIAKLTEVCPQTIYNKLLKFNIPVRSSGEALHLRTGNHCKLTQEATEWLNGELLGDGSLSSCSTYSARFSYGSKYPEYIQYVSDTLKSFGIEQAGKIAKRHHKDRDYYSYHYQSLYYVELLPIYKQWYPNRKKIIPRDIELTSLALRQHHIGDGCLHHNKNEKPYIRLSTDGFPINDVKWLVKKLIELGFKSTRQPSNNSTRISAYSTKAFLDYIGECPVECYQYKFNY